FQVTPKVSHLHAVKRIFRYLKGQPKLGLRYPRDSPFDLEAFSDSDYAGASLDRKSTTRGCQFLGKRLISWQCKKQIVVANSTTEAKYVATANCCGQVLWIQNQMLDYGLNFMNTKMNIDNESTICIVKNLVYHSKIKHIEIRHHFIRDSYEKRPIQVIKIHTDHNVADLLTKAFDVSSDVFGVKTSSCKATAKSKRVNDVKQIHATADGKTVVISKSLMGSDIHFNDEDGITYLSNDEIFEKFALMGIDLAKPFNDVYVIHVHTKKVFTNMKRQNKDFSGTITPLFASILVPQVVEGEGSGQPSKPQPPSSTAPPSHEEHSSGPPKNVGDEVVYTREDDRVVRAATTATSLEAEQESGAQTMFETASKQSYDPTLSEVNTSGSGVDSMEHQDNLTDFVPPTPHDSPLSGGHTPGSDEGRPNINELIAICTQLSNRVLALEQSMTAQDLVIKKLQKKVKRLEKKQRARTPGMNLFKIGTSKRKSLDKENVSKQVRNMKTRFEEGDFDDVDDMVDKEMENVEGDTVNASGAVNTATTRVSAASASVTTVGVSISTAEPRTPPTTTTKAFKDEDLTIAQTLVQMISEKAKEKGVAFTDVEESDRPTTILPTIDPKDKGKGIMKEPENPPKNLRKAQIQMDEELANRIHEEMVELERRQREIVAADEASKAAINQELNNIQAMIEADEQMAARLQSEEQEQFTIEEKSRMLVELIAERKRFFVAQRVAEQRSKPPTKSQIRNRMCTYLKNQAGYNHNQLKRRMVKDSGKKDDSSQKQAESSKNRPRAEHVKESVKKQKLEDDAEKEELIASLDIIIRANRSSKNYNIFTEMCDDFDRQDMRLFDSCGVHVLLMDTGIDIHMMVERKYPLKQEMLSRMLNRRLEVDHEKGINSKFDGNADEGFFVGYSTNSKAFRIQTIRGEEKKDAEDPRNEDNTVPSTEEPKVNQKKDVNVNSTNNVNTVSSTDNASGIKANAVNENIVYGCADDPNMPELEDIVYSDNDENVGTEADMNNLDTYFQVSHVPTTRIHKDRPLNQVIRDLQSAPQTRRMTKNLEAHARLVEQGYTQEEGIDYDDVFAPVFRIEGIRLFLAYASFKDFVVYQMDVKSAFLYDKIKEEVYVCQPPGFEDPDFPDKVYKVEKAFYGLHQAPKAWYETLSTYLLDNGFQREKIDKNLFIKRDKSDILLMSSMGELTFFLGLQVKQEEDGIFISQDKYVNEILNKFGFSDVKTASTPMKTHKTFLKDDKGEDVDEHLYRSIIGSLMYLASSKPDIMFAVCQPKLGLWYPKDSPFDLVAYTDSDYAGASLDRKSTTTFFVGTILRMRVADSRA
ncbi:putative ribonuclease H-like domain-containing protein, partial [Tanacetum coccineum]